MKSYGEGIIASIEIGRTLVPRILKFMLNVISFGEFGKRFRQSEYNNLYHLFMIIIPIEGIPLVTDLINEAVTDPVGKLVVGFAMNALSDAIKKDVMDENNEEVNNVNTLENV